MTDTSAQSDEVRRSVGTAAEALLSARDDAAKLKRLFAHSSVPMVIVDADRRYVEANRPARLALRLSLDDIGELTIDDLTPSRRIEDLAQAWAQLLDTGSVAGCYPVTGGGGGRVDIVYQGLAHVLPGLQLIAFAPADWHEDELNPVQADRAHFSVRLTRREIEVLRLAADGLGGLELAQQLVLSPDTVRTHLKNIYRKLRVRNRAAAVAKAMRLGLID
jgi:DNA-binding CsgD family transcriptional regulator